MGFLGIYAKQEVSSFKIQKSKNCPLKKGYVVTSNFCTLLCLSKRHKKDLVETDPGICFLLPQSIFGQFCFNIGLPNKKFY